MENPGRGQGAWRRQGGGGEPGGGVGKENVEGEGSLEEERRGGREPEPRRGRGTTWGEVRGGARSGGGELRRGGPSGGSAAMGVASGSSLRFLTRSALQPPSLPPSPAALGAGLAAHSFQSPQSGLSRGLGGARVRSPRAALRTAAAQSPEAAGRCGSAVGAPDGPRVLRSVPRKGLHLPSELQDGIRAPRA